MESSLEYQHIVDLISARLGLVFNPHRHKLLQSALERKLLTNQSISALRATLTVEVETHPTWQILVEALTVGETYFFRNQAHLKALHLRVLPELIEQRRKAGRKHLRIWSAGCASGEEPYSLAMMLRDILPDIETWSIDMLGTDINEGFLARAKAGAYRSHSFRGETPDWLQRRWFSAGDDGFDLAPTIRRMVRFAPLNLVTGEFPPAGTFDIILCRNVTIYFDRQQTQHVVERLTGTLVEGGWLIVGHSEPQSEVYDAFNARNFENAIFYQKPVKDLNTPVVFEPIVEPRVPAPPAFVESHIAEIEATPPKETTPEAMGLWERAHVAANSENWGEAFRLLEKAEQDDALQPEVHYLRALIHMQMGDLQTATDSLRQALYCDPAFALAHYMLGELHDQTGAIQEAKRHWQQARKALSVMGPQELLIFGDDLTVEILSGLLEYRLKNMNRGA